jgi:hypothetical protein
VIRDRIRSPWLGERTRLAILAGRIYILARTGSSPKE